MTTSRLLAAALIAVSLAGCRIGPRVATFSPALNAAGVGATLETASGTVEAELLELGEEGLLIITDGRVARISYAAIRRGEFHQTRIRIVNGIQPPPAARERLRLLSRYPQGVSPALLEALLAAYDQDQVEVIVD